MQIRCAAPGDLGAVAAVEAACFPAAEAATPDALAARLAVYPSHFLLLWDGAELAGFINGMPTSEPDLRDAMYDDATLADEAGAWQMVFGLDVAPAYRGRGLSGMLLRALIDQARREGRRGVVLTCKAGLRGLYARFGFVDEGVSGSTHGGVVWHQMRLTFPEQAEQPARKKERNQ